MTDITQTRLRELFEFDADAGLLIWKQRPFEAFAKLSEWKMWQTRFVGAVAGYVGKEGYHQISFDRKLLSAHRLIWIYVNGPIPAGMQIDHINGVRDDNRLSNLRLVTHAENGRNQAMPRNNTSGLLGVSWHQGSLKWRAQIQINGRNKHLGSFETIADASKARAKAEHEFGFHPNHGRKSQL